MSPEATPDLDPGAAVGGSSGRGADPASWQWLVLAGAFAVLCGLQWHNDGLWAPDAARHFANGQFWGDFLQAFRLDARDYALSYYARYPAIKPTAYPPVFYLVEAACFAILGPSPYVAKAAVLAFSALAAIYTALWLRRFVAPFVGFAGALLLFLPETIIWSHAVMLQVPSLALGTASMYHGRRWLDSDPRAPDWRQFWLGFAFGGLAVGTYFQAATLAVVLLAWLVVERRFALLARRSVGIALVGLGALVLVALPFLLRWAPSQLSFAIPRLEWLLRSTTWTHYLPRLPVLFTPLVLGLAALGVAGGLLSRRFRRESRMLLVWAVVPYLLLSAASVKEDRYLLFLAPPVVGLAVVGVLLAARRVADALSRGGRTLGADMEALARRLAMAALALLLVGLIANPWRTPVPSVEGFRAVVAFVEEHAPEGAVFYDGPNHGIFVSLIQAGDPDYRRRVVVGSKLLYSYMVMVGWRLHEYVHSPEEAEALLRRRAGARLVLVETAHQSDVVDAQKHLREAVKGPGFEHLASFPLSGWRVERVDVYRLLGDIEEPDTVDLPFPILGEGVRYEVAPIQR